MPDDTGTATVRLASVSATPLATTAICGICLFASLQVATGADWFGMAATACLLALPVFGWRLLRLREKYLLSLAALVAMAVAMTSAGPGKVLETALERGAYLAGFLTLLSLLRDAATTSDSVLAVGRMLTSQPPGRRYWAIALGGHAMGVIMNFGALSLLGPLVQRGARAGGDVDPRIAAIREQRQLSALARGFSWFIAWSPTAISQLVAVTVVAGARSATIALFGAVTAALVIVAGWLVDRAAGIRARLQLPAGQPLQHGPVTPFPWRELGRLFLIYATIIIISAAFAVTLGLPLVTGIMLAALPVTLLWIFAQIASGRGDGRSFAERARDLVTRTVPDGSPEAITLALAGFIGTALAAALPGSGGGMSDSIVGLPPAVVCIGVVTIVPLASLVGLPALLMVTFLGTFLSGALQGLVDPNMLALSLVCGWAVNLTGSPFGGTNLILSRITGIPATTLAFRWNAIFSLCAWAVSVAVLSLLSVMPM
ncbi:MAG: hypothetical protein R3D45_00500 [Rhizobiaceae bacterium]